MDELEKKISSAKAAHVGGNAKNSLHNAFGGTYVKDFVFGANDGIVTTFAVVAGVAGASLAPSVILILGIAKLIADCISMAAGNYLGTKSELEYQKSERTIEEWEVDNIPEEETKEIRQIYAAKGFSGADLDTAVRVITRNKKVWVDEMMVDELGIVPGDEGNPLKNSAVTFVAFMTAGSMPLMPYIFGVTNALWLSIVMSGITLFFVGSLRTFITHKKWYISGLEMLMVGAVASSVAYGIGWWLERIVK